MDSTLLKASFKLFKQTRLFIFLILTFVALSCSKSRNAKPDRGIVEFIDKNLSRLSLDYIVFFESELIECCGDRELVRLKKSLRGNPGISTALASITLSDTIFHILEALGSASNRQ